MASSIGLCLNFGRYIQGIGEASLICAVNLKSEINSHLAYFLFTGEPKLAWLYFIDTQDCGLKKE